VKQIHNLNGLTFKTSFYISKFSGEGIKTPSAKIEIKAKSGSD